MAIVGLFQGGKSLLINAALGGAFLPVGKFGLRTTPCRIRCRYGEINRAVASLAECSQRALSLRALPAFVEEDGTTEQLQSIDLFLSHPLLSEVELLDTPGIDHSDGDNETALAAAREADAVVLIIQQSLPAASDSFQRLSECLRDKPWGLVLNCGRAGSHLDYPNSQASIEVEEHSLRQLRESGLQEPIFSQRMSARTLSYYASEQFEHTRTLTLSNEHKDDLSADEESIRKWRENLLQIGNHWLNECLERVRQQVLLALDQLNYTDSQLKFNSKRKHFTCWVGVGGDRYKVLGKFRIETMSSIEQLVLYNFSCSEEWITEWLQTNPEWHTWKFT